MTRAAVSTQINKLTEHAGNPLFEQFGKMIYLTPAGTELSEIIIAQFEAAFQSLIWLGGTSVGICELPYSPHQ